MLAWGSLPGLLYVWAQGAGLEPPEALQGGGDCQLLPLRVPRVSQGSGAWRSGRRRGNRLPRGTCPDLVQNWGCEAEVKQ